MLFLDPFPRNWLEKPKEKKGSRQENCPTINSFMSRFTEKHLDKEAD